MSVNRWRFTVPAVSGIVGDEMTKKVKVLDNVAGQAAEVEVCAALQPAVAARQLSTDQQKRNLADIGADTVAEIIHLLETDERITHEDLKARYNLSEHSWLALRRHLDDLGRGFNRARWARHTAATLARFTQLGAERLASEVGEMPLAALPIAVAVAIDKLILLSSDRPAVVIEARLRLSAEDLCKMLAEPASAAVIDITPEPVEQPKGGNATN